MGIPEKIKAIQDEMAKTQINKATEHHIGLLKAKIAKLKREQEADITKKSGMKQDGFDVRRSGDATVVFIGLPSVGKSTLLNKMTGAKSTVGAFQFTTLTVVPGMMEYRGAKIQVLDLPGIIKGATNPFPWMSEIMDLRKEKNFFETRVIEYQTGGALNWE